MRNAIVRVLLPALTIAALAAALGCSQSSKTSLATAQAAAKPSTTPPATSSAPVTDSPEPVPCPDVPGATPPATQKFSNATCPETACSDGNHLTFPVEAWLHSPNHPDPDVCIRGNLLDRVHWQSGNSAKTINIVRVDEFGTKNAAYIFDCKGKKCAGPFPTDNSSTDNVDSTALFVNDGSLYGCHEFKATIKVTDKKTGQSVCYDPHIYTDCTNCSLRKPPHPKKK